MPAPQEKRAPGKPSTGPKGPASLSTRDGHRRTRESHGEELIEDYVEAIADCIEAEGEARAVDLAKKFGVTHVSVVKAVARLQKNGYVTAEPYRSIFLTEKGRKLAAHCRARHEIVLDLLLALGVPRSAALIDAEGIEHHVGRETLSHFKKFLSQRRVR